MILGAVGEVSAALFVLVILMNYDIIDERKSESRCEEDAVQCD